MAKPFVVLGNRWGNNIPPILHISFFSRLIPIYVRLQLIAKLVLSCFHDTFYCLLLGGLKPPASAGSFQHEHVPLVA